MLNIPKYILAGFVFALALALNACQNSLDDKQKPNILWICLEDTSPLLNCYGDSTVITPHIDQLASQGVVFSSAFMPAPVCSASRSSMITGMMATTLGLHNHHSSRTEESAIYLPDSIQTIPELFKEAGYFTFNNGKDDYNFTYDRLDLYDQNYSYHPLYGKSGDRYEISELKDKTPFFGQIQLYGGKEIFFSKFDERVANPIDRSKIKLPPYLPNHEAVIEEYADHYDAIQITDERLGQIIEELKENGLLENTIVFFFSDHGMRQTRHKQFLYDGGIHVPLIIADFRMDQKTAVINDDLISGIDFGPSSLAFAGIEVPKYMEGQSIFDIELPPRDYVISTRDRCDFTIDRIRSVRSKDYKYIRNFMTDRPYLQPTYMDVDEVAFVKVMQQLYADDQLDTVQRRFLLEERPAEELYNLQKDPFEINNLADDPDYVDILNQYAQVLDDWIEDTNDQGQYPEKEEGLKLMLGIWGDHAINPEYNVLRKADNDFPGSQFYLKSEEWNKVSR